MLAELDTMEREALAEMDSVADAAALEAFRVRWLGTNGRLRGAMDALKTVPKDQKPAVGKRLNEVKARIEALFNARRDSAAVAPKGPPVDVTEPGLAVGEGARHVLTKTIDEIVDVLGSVNGKKLGRRRISASGPKKALANCTSVVLRSTMDTRRSTQRPST